MNAKSKLGLGLIAGASTGVFWGIPFLAPQVLQGYSSFEIAFGRFFFFGLVGLFFIKRVIGIFLGLTPMDRLKVLALSALGFWLYSSLLFWSIQRTNGVVASLVLGLLPVTIPLGTPGRRSGGWMFYFGLSLIAGGLLVLLGYPSAGSPGEGSAVSGAGVLGLFLCLTMWTVFAISNSKFLQKRSTISRRDFSSLMGLISLLSLLPFFLISMNWNEWVGRPMFSKFLFISFALGVGSSWFANWLWNIASVHCPSEISGTLLVFETLFGVTYTFIYQSRAPHVHEWVAIFMCLTGVLLAITGQVKTNRVEGLTQS